MREVSDWRIPFGPELGCKVTAGTWPKESAALDEWGRQRARATAVRERMRRVPGLMDMIPPVVAHPGSESPGFGSWDLFLLFVGCLLAVESSSSMASFASSQDDEGSEGHEEPDGTREFRTGSPAVTSATRVRQRGIDQVVTCVSDPIVILVGLVRVCDARAVVLCIDHPVIVLVVGPTSMAGTGLTAA